MVDINTVQLIVNLEQTKNKLVKHNRQLMTLKSITYTHKYRESENIRC